MKKQILKLFILTTILLLTTYCQAYSTKSNRKNQLVENEQIDSKLKTDSRIFLLICNFSSKNYKLIKKFDIYLCYDN